MRICFVGTGYKSMKGISEGGSERQIALLAHSLSKQNHSVSFVATGSIVKESKIKGISVFSAWDTKRGIKGLRFFISYLPSLYQILLEIDADVYYIRGFSLFAPVVVRAASLLNSISILALASDSDLHIKERVKLGNFFSRFLKSSYIPRSIFRKYVLKKASVVLAQTNEQAKVCAELSIHYRIIPNAITDPVFECEESSKKWDIAWIGHISLRKGFKELLSIAKELKELNFYVVGDVVHEVLRPVLDELCLLPNISFQPVMNHAQVLNLIRNSKIVINTSPLEGFSNVFLESWLLRTPVVSLNANPNSLFSDSTDFGYCANGSLPRMVKAIRKLVSDDLIRLDMGSRARDYVLGEHSLAMTTRKLIDVCENP